MPIMTFSDLVTAVGDTLNRADLTGVVPNFIALVEAQMNRRLRTQDMITRNDAFAITGIFTPLPLDVQVVREVRITSISPTYKLVYRTPAQMADLATLHCDTPDQPNYFTVSGMNLEVEAAPNAPYTARLAYYARIPSLSAANPFNWMLIRHPDAYLYGALVQSAPYLKDDERLAVWQSLYQNALQEIEAGDEDYAYSGGVMAASIRSMG